MAKPRSVFVCQRCGLRSGKWLGRCPECGEWNSLVEEALESSRPAGAVRSGDGPQPIVDVKASERDRFATRIGELDRVLGGGLVPGSLVLLGGDPGVGKSTLLLQALDGLAKDGPVLYVSGEESVEQSALRASRLGVREKALHVLCETELERILSIADEGKPRALAVDSVQTVFSSALGSIPGSVGQVREAAGRLLAYAKSRRVPVILVGHVTKDGNLAGPKTLEHVVDTVLYFEGERSSQYRVLRASKNRFGSTNEIGVFEMHGGGLREVENPSALFLAERPLGAPGSVVAAALEGTRPILVEVQALVASAHGVPRRNTLGADPQRVALLLAVIERRAGIDLLGDDVFVNVVGGVRLDEPAADLAVVAALCSSARRQAVDAHTLVFGEVGLAGEVRAVAQAEVRLVEAERLGFRRCVLPEANRARLPSNQASKLELVGVTRVDEALSALIG
jgi:DNA repair protein RadA/Sms